MEFRRIVGVVGPSNPTPKVYHDAYELGLFLGKYKDIVVVNGGLGGIMEAVSRGVKESGGFSLGLLPGGKKEVGNPYLSLALPTNLGHFRNFLIAQVSDFLIAVGESKGTINEVTTALIFSKPVYAVNWNTFLEGIKIFESLDELIPVITELLEGGG